MAFLKEFLSGAPAPRRKRTQGNIVPIPKRTNPYQGRGKVAATDPAAKSVSTNPNENSSSNGNSNSNLLGALAQTKGQGKSVSTGMEINYESDPVLARIKALNTQNVGNARTEAAALRKQAIIDTGFDDVGRDIGLDSNTVEAAKQNPFSTKATIERTAKERGRELDDSLNQQNLYYSGYRADQLGELGRNTAEAQTRAGSSLRSLLAGVDSGVKEVEQRAYAEEQAALQEAAMAQQQAAMQQAYMDSLAAMLEGQGGGWGDGGGGGGGGDPPPADPNLALSGGSGLQPGVGYKYLPDPYGGAPIAVPGGAYRAQQLDDRLGVDQYALAQALRGRQVAY